MLDEFFHLSLENHEIEVGFGVEKSVKRGLGDPDWVGDILDSRFL